MSEDVKKINLLDLIDLQLLQGFQDAFANAMDVASLTYDKEIPITKPSNFTEFCTKYTRGCELGAKRCNECDLRWAKIAAEKGEPVIYKCHTGLMDFVVPIMVEGQHIASIFGGQVLTEKPDEEKFREIAREFKINEDKYIEALRKIKIVPEKNVKAAAQLLFLVANAISELAQNNFKLIKKNEREVLLRNINETIRGTLDINETKKTIVNLIGKTFNADRCFIAEYDNEHDKFFLIKDEYRSSDAIIPYFGADPNKDVPHFADAMKKRQILLINNKEIFLDGVAKPLDFEEEKEAIEKYKVNSVFSIPLFYDKEFLGVFSIHYVREHFIDEDEIRLVTIIADQIAVALHQAKLYNIVKQTTASQTAILNNMPFMAWLKDTQSRLLSVNEEYARVCNTTVDNIIGKTDFDLFPKDFAESYINEDRMVMEKKQTIPSEDLISGPQGLRWHETFKSPVFDDKGNVIGTAGLSRDITERKESELELLNKQKAIIKSNEREKLYRSIMEAARSTLDFDKTKKKIVDIIGKTLNADRCFIVEYDKSNEKFLIVKDEYLSSNAIKSYRGNDVNKTVPNFVAALKDGKRVLINNREILMEMNGVDFELENKAIKNNNVNAAYAFPLFYQGEFLGGLVIHYVEKEREIGDDEIDLMEAIVNQIAIAFHQAQLYEQERITAQREFLLRKIIETLRSTINLEQMKQYFVEIIGNYFDADRCLFVEYDREANKMLPIKTERLKSSNVKSLMGLDPDVSLPEFCAKIKEGKNVIAKDVEKLSSRKKFAEYKSIQALVKLGVKSDYALVVKYKEQSIGALVIHFVEKKRNLSHEEFNFLKILNDQAGIAIYQTELYETKKQQVEREVILRKITEIIRSSIDIDFVKNAMVLQIGKFLNADRVAFADYDHQKENYFISPGNEYLSSKKVKTFAGIDFASIPGFISAIRTLHLSGKDIIFSDLDKYISDNNLKDSGIENFYKDMGFMSSLAINISYGEAFYGNLVITFEKKREITQDDIKIVKNIADQAGIAIYQSTLYKQEKQAAEREALLRNITEKIRSTLDIDELFELICRELVNVFDVQRAFIVRYDLNNKGFIIKKEFKTAGGVQGLGDINFDSRTIDYWGQILLREGREIVIDNISESDTPDYFKETYKNIGEKATIGIAIQKDEDHWGWVGIAEYNDYRHWNEEEINLLKTISGQIYIAIKQAELYENEKKAAQREALLRNITEKIRSTLDIDTILSYICEESINIFNVQRAVIAEFRDRNDYSRDIIRKECKSREGIKSLADVTLDVNVTAYWGRSLLLEHDLFSFGNLSELNAPDYFKVPYEQIGLKSAVSAAIKKEQERWGIIILFDYDNYRRWTDDEINLLETISGQLYIAIQQAELHNETLVDAQRESLIAKITSIAISTFDLNKIKQIVTDIGIITKADRCYYVEVDLENMKGKPIRYDREYLASSDVESVIGYDFPSDEVKQFISLFLESQDLSVFDYEKILEDKSQEYQGIRKYIQKFKMKSGVGIPFFYMNKLSAVLAIEYSKEKVLPTDDELDFLRILGNQIGMAFSQIQLYQNTKTTAEREALLRRIFEIMRSSLDINFIKSKVVEEVGKVLDADRCFILAYDSINDYFFVDESSEYRGNEDEKSLIGTNAKDLNLNWFVDALKHNKETNFADVEKFIVEHNLQDNGEEDFFHKFNIKSGYHIPILYGKRLLGYIGLNYTKGYKLLDESDLEFLKIIATQAGIAFHQAKLYNLTKIQADRERLYRSMTETIRSSLDIDKTKKIIVDSIGKTIGADRCFIIDYDQNEDKFLVVNDEYLSSDEISSYIGTDVNVEVPNLMEELKRGQMVFIEEKEKFLSEKGFEFDIDKKSVEKYEVTSAYGFPLFYYNDLLGVLGIHYVKHLHKITEEEINLISIIVNQIAIALHQAQLFKITKLQAEREKISRNIIEILRSSLDKYMVKNLFVKNIGKYFGADRVFFSEFDSDTKMYLPVDSHSEYLSSSEEKSFINYDWSDESISEYIQPLIERKEIKIPNWDQYIKENPKSQGFISLFEDANVKSSYNMPVLYQQRLMGYFCIEFTHKVYKLSEEDINLIRSICRQAGIALYQAELYLEAQTAARIKDDFIKNMAQDIRAQLSNISQLSYTLSNSDLECEGQNEYINNLNQSIRQLLELTDGII